MKGTATYSGQPIPKGRIFFDPDDPAGQQGSAAITAGRYDTAADGQGIAGGKYTVRVQGYDGRAANEAPFGQPLFPEHTFPKDLPAADSELNVDVPRGGR